MKTPEPHGYIEFNFGDGPQSADEVPTEGDLVNVTNEATGEVIRVIVTNVERTETGYRLSFLPEP